MLIFSPFDIEAFHPLDHDDTNIDFGDLGNFSIAGMEIRFSRQVSAYIMNYFYLPSGFQTQLIFAKN